MRSPGQYKALSIEEFTKAASSYETDHAGVYELCKDEYPSILAELESMCSKAGLDMETFVNDKVWHLHMVARKPR